MSRTLAGIGVVVTRPRSQADALIDRLRALGATVAPLPTIEIEPVDDPDSARALAAALEAADWLVFVSPGGVEVLLERFGGDGVVCPPNARVAAVGPGTARALRGRGWPVDASPAQGGGAAALLDSPAFDPAAGSNCVILAGEHGRALLADTLAARGVRVTRLGVYRAVVPDVDPAPVVAGWRAGWLQYTIVTSVTGLSHLRELVGPEGWEAACGSRLITVSERVAERARALGVHEVPVIAARPGDEGLIEALGQAAEASTGSHP
ncbi:Uroporphyrinogen-III synthase [wastewater metagenome]|uniref:uroporphyrinogen-III synthase n=2 Tax=unclassified sequences TaxID=12908 RepID=A0A5B8RBG3_9ZZZZ|nr:MULTISPECIES: uroporphyrinogen-III synthase [Arhodomonas]QEA04027.1 uroporphyrinogen-III synthase [uncultured organism]